MGVPTSEVGYTSATTGRGDHEVHKGHLVVLAKIIKIIHLSVTHNCSLWLNELEIIDVIPDRKPSLLSIDYTRTTVHTLYYSSKHFHVYFRFYQCIITEALNIISR
jgi:hypothetical protein